MSDRAEVLARHISPDGELVFCIEREDGTISFGFEALPWHLHPQQVDYRGDTDLDIALAVADDLVHDRLVVVRLDWPDAREYRILDDMDLPAGCELPGHSASLRLWSGRIIEIEELTSRDVVYRLLRAKGRVK